MDCPTIQTRPSRLARSSLELREIYRLTFARPVRFVFQQAEFGTEAVVEYHSERVDRRDIRVQARAAMLGEVIGV